MGRLHREEEKGLGVARMTSRIWQGISKDKLLKDQLLEMSHASFTFREGSFTWREPCMRLLRARGPSNHPARSVLSPHF